MTDGKRKENKMEYRKFDNVIVARIDKDEEILEQLKVIAIKEKYKACRYPGSWSDQRFHSWSI